MTPYTHRNLSSAVLGRLQHIDQDNALIIDAHGEQHQVNADLLHLVWCPLLDDGIKLLVCDIDGTLVNNLGRAQLLPETDLNNTASWEAFNKACANDAPIQYRLAMLQLLAPHYHLVYLTSRCNSCREETQACLRAIGAPSAPLFMREPDDHRSSPEFKEAEIGRLLTAFHKSPESLVLIDDDDRVCQHISGTFAGATVIQVPSECAATLRASGQLLSHLTTHQKGKDAQA